MNRREFLGNYGIATLIGVGAGVGMGSVSLLASPEEPLHKKTTDKRWEKPFPRVRIWGITDRRIPDEVFHELVADIEGIKAQLQERLIYGKRAITSPPKFLWEEERIGYFLRGYEIRERMFDPIILERRLHHA